MHAANDQEAMLALVQLGRNIKKQRQAVGLTQLGLAKVIGCGKSTVTKYEMGRQEPCALMLKRLARAMKTSMDALMVDVFCPLAIEPKPRKKPVATPTTAGAIDA